MVLKKKDQQAIDEFRKRVSRLLGNDLVRLALFGSKLTGKDTPESDIDVLVLVNDTAMELKYQILDIAFEINLNHGVYISPRIIAMSTFDDPVWSLTPFLKELRDNGLTL